MDHIQETKINNFPHELYYTVLIPFYLDTKEDEVIDIDLNDNCLHENYFNKGKIIKKNSQFYDYVEDLFLEESVYFEGNKELIDKFQEEIFQKSRHKVKKVFLHSVFTNIIILGIVVKFKSLNIIEKIHEQKLQISDEIKRYEIKKLIKSLFNDNYNYDIVYFDSYDGGNNNNTIRFHNFADLIIENNSDFVSDELKDNIACYFLDRMSIATPKNSNSFSKNTPYYGGLIYDSAEGIVSIYEKNKINSSITRRFVNKGFNTNSIMFAYLLILQEFYKLHFIKIKTQRLFRKENIENFDIDNKKIINGLNALERQIVVFNAKCHITISTNFIWIRNIYNDLYNTLQIKEYLDEVNSSISVYKDYFEKKTKEKNARISKSLDTNTKVFTSVTICNALISITTAFIYAHLNEGSNDYKLTITNRLFIFWIPAFIALIYLIIIFKSKIFNILKKILTSLFSLIKNLIKLIFKNKK